MIRAARFAFTLIELLVVITIIVLLISVLLPSLQRAREQSKRARCAANLHQQAHAWQMYWITSNGHPPLGPNAHINYGGLQGAGDAVYGADPANPVSKPLNPHLNHQPVLREGGEEFHCPDDRGGGPQASPTNFEYYGSSYMTNRFVVGPVHFNASVFCGCEAVMEEMNNHLSELNVEQAKNQEKVILMGDAGWLNTWHPGLTDEPENRIEWHRARYTHNVAFLDGHVEFLKLIKGKHETPDYSVLPLLDLQQAVSQCQHEGPCP